MDAELAVAPSGCPHLGSFKVDNWKQNLRAIYQCFVWSGTAEARKRKVRTCPGGAEAVRAPAGAARGPSPCPGPCRGSARTGDPWPPGLGRGGSAGAPGRHPHVRQGWGGGWARGSRASQVWPVRVPARCTPAWVRGETRWAVAWRPEKVGISPFCP